MRAQLLDTLLLLGGFALKGNASSLKLKLLNPSAQNRLGNAEGAACIHVAIALFKNQCGSIAFELRGK
ncbi:hypothetical protein PPN31114_00197 [Pandoraea pneumonica]|uniref:Uncharacterized protein n=1 Tax=Pandoraea pneumonica TaxID=2508299 RepID=A0A5E4RI13_9BURK|nr:hypothetical protein PPN31114_00197 [Pandoraea pneumonica]